MQNILKSFLKRLTNLSGTNRSLVLLKLSKEQDLDLHLLDFNNNLSSFNIIKQLVEGKRKILLGDVIDSRSGKANEISLQLKKLERKDKFIYDERGAKELYLGWPFVRGKLMDDTLIRCPLLFFPVYLDVENDKWFLKHREGEEISLNKNFLLAYSNFNKVKVSDEFIESTFEDWESDITTFRTNLYKLLSESSLRLNFNQELFTDQLKFFTNFSREEFEQNHQTGELKLYPEAVLGIFPQAGSYLVPDYEELLANSNFTDLEEFFISRTIQADKIDSGSFKFLNKVKEEHTFTPFSLDASQENALKAVKKGNSVVVQGPPGTGKSQLISNLVADYIARGKKVLLVCQKRAALDVVYNRLLEKELADFAGLVHDFRNDRQLIYDQVLRQIERLEEYKSNNNSLDALYLERVFLSSSRQIDQIAEELESFKTALFDTKECGVSIKELYLSSSPHAKIVDLENYFKSLLPTALPEILIRFKSWLYYAFKFKNRQYSWYSRKSFAHYTNADFKKLLILLDYIPEYRKVLNVRFAGLLNHTVELKECEEIVKQEVKINDLVGLLQTQKVFEDFKSILDKDTDEEFLKDKQIEILSLFESGGFEQSLLLNDVLEYEQLLNKVYEQKQSAIKWFIWKSFSQEKSKVLELLNKNQLKFDDDGLSALYQKLQKRLQFEKQLAELKDIQWLKDVPATQGINSLKNWFDKKFLAIKGKRLFAELKFLKDLSDLNNIDQVEFVNRLASILASANESLAERNNWYTYFTTLQVEKLLTDRSYSEVLKDELNIHFNELCEFDKLEESLSHSEKSVFEKVFDAAENESIDDCMVTFSNSIKLQWIDHIENKYPVLKCVSGKKMEQLEEQLENAVKEKLKVSKEIVLLRARERTYKYIDYNRLNNMVTYRDLKHQVSKKRKVWPLRRLIATFHQELFELVPCWMASPESVSAIFPMEQLFDLVIFDEASQCFSEKGIPSMYRGQQIMITGDEMQLSPNDLYHTRFEDEAEESPELEAESLLDLAGKYLMQVQLKGHYRSKSLELIHFSNVHFYGNSLQLLPEYNYVVKDQKAIDFIKTDGVWEKNINRTEAECVVDLILNLVNDKPVESIGVVTFNYPQQLLIQDLVEEAFVERKLPVPGSLFVKNIENVQGDERDHIIFSIGYAPDRNGKMNMNFGSLNLSKGENRLNVAITRARIKVHIVTSVYAHQLNTENSAHNGPKLLKKYLQYATEVSEGRFNAKPEEYKNFGADWLLKNKLRNIEEVKELTLKEEFPYADITVRSRNNYKGLILTDDNLYLQSISVKDAHAYLPISMKQKDWKYSRIYSRQYWEKPDLVKELIKKHFEG